jgi:hypothetical protein
MEQGGLRAVHALRVAHTSGSAITAHPIREWEVRDERRIGEATFRRYAQSVLWTRLEGPILAWM